MDFAFEFFCYTLAILFVLCLRSHPTTATAPVEEIAEPHSQAADSFVAQQIEKEFEPEPIDDLLAIAASPQPPIAEILEAMPYRQLYALGSLKGLQRQRKRESLILAIAA